MPQLDDLNFLDIITGVFLNIFGILIINYFGGADLIDDSDYGYDSNRASYYFVYSYTYMINY
jgi:hypothetical protein